MIKNMARVQVLAAERFGWAAGPSGRAGRRGVPTGLRCAVRAERRKKKNPRRNSCVSKIYWSTGWEDRLRKFGAGGKFSAACGYFR